MTIFDFDDYRKFVRERIASMPKRGHGQYRKIAQFLSIGSVNVSQVFKGDRHLTLEQAWELSRFFGLAKLESQYFVTLVEKDRAATVSLKKYFEERLEDLRQRAMDLKQRLPQQAQLSDEAKAVFYSSWTYSGIRLLSSIAKFQTPDLIAQYFNLPLNQVNRILEFLVATGLCRENAGKYSIGPSSTHLEASSPLIARHHTNWRLKSVEHLERLQTDELCLSMPCSLSPRAFRVIRKELTDCIERITKIIDEAPCEELACLNVDFFRF